MPTASETTGKTRRGVARNSAITAETAEEVIQTSFRLPRSRWARLQQLSIEERLSVQAIIVAALEGEFRRRGKTF